jgi:multidrug efflux pump subunit AcrA (membrane-fusion protein)
VEAKYLNAKNTEESIREKLKLLGVDLSLLADKENPNVVNRLVIKSPITGSVFKEFATAGSSIEPNTELANIINLSKLYADIDVYEQDLDQVQLGQEVGIEFINKNISTTTGIVKHIVNSIDPESRAIKIHVDFSAPKGSIVLPEMAVKVKIIGKKAKVGKPTVPLSALLQEGELNFLFYALPKNEKLEFHKIKVSVGENNGTYTEVGFSETLPKEALIVQNNVYLIDSESKKKGF